MKLDKSKSGVSRLALSNKHIEIIAVGCTANFDGLITEELTHAAGLRKAEWA